MFSHEKKGSLHDTILSNTKRKRKIFDHWAKPKRLLVWRRHTKKHAIRWRPNRTLLLRGSDIYYFVFVFPKVVFVAKCVWNTFRMTGVSCVALTAMCAHICWKVMSRKEAARVFSFCWIIHSNDALIRTLDSHHCIQTQHPHLRFARHMADGHKRMRMRILLNVQFRLNKICKFIFAKSKTVDSSGASCSFVKGKYCCECNALDACRASDSENGSKSFSSSICHAVENCVRSK